MLSLSYCKMQKDTTSFSGCRMREGKIDLKEIDYSKDRKVFQYPMNWNVISDVTGKCPTYKMKLKEVSMNEAKRI